MNVLLSGLSPDTTYYWHVRASNSGGTTYSNGAPATFWSFTTQTNTSWNDNIDFAKIASAPYTDTLDTTQATAAGNDPIFSCVQGQRYNTVWYRLNPASSLDLTIDTVGSDYDTVLGVWTGSPGALNPVACNDDFGGLHSRIYLPVTVGTTYYVEVASYNPGGGNLTLNIVTGDNIPPIVTSVARASADPTSASSVAFQVVFSEPVTGVGTEAPFNDFALLTSGVTGASISSVSGSGATYTVTVNTGSGNGTIRLSVLDDDTILDLNGNELGGQGTGNGEFTSSETYTINKEAIFLDVQTTYWAREYVERLYAAGITGGCTVNPLQYCPEDTVTRAQMAVFLERGMKGSSYSPPPAGSNTGFGDVQPTYWAAAWIKQLAFDGITGGCGNGIYCPEAPVTRAQMAVFLLRSKYGAAYTPPPAGGSTGFEDVPPGYWAAAWIKQLVAEGITAGCGNGDYCPESPVTRAQMAVFLVKTFNLP
jgi:hypothetical protein